jgi:hypothetical protein
MQLEVANDHLQRRVEFYEKSLDQFRAFLATEKFLGCGSDGSRKDWIATGDVANWILETKRDSLDAMYPNYSGPDPSLPLKDDSQWVTLQPVAKLDRRQLFILQAAKLYRLLDDTFDVAGQSRLRVEKGFHTAMQSAPIPEKIGYQSGLVTREYCFAHLVSCRLQGVKLPFPISHFAPVEQHQPESLAWKIRHSLQPL